MVSQAWCVGCVFNTEVDLSRLGCLVEQDNCLFALRLEV